MRPGVLHIPWHSRMDSHNPAHFTATPRHRHLLTLAVQEKGPQRATDQQGEWDAYLGLLAQVQAIRRDKHKLAKYVNTFEVQTSSSFSF